MTTLPIYFTYLQYLFMHLFIYLFIVHARYSQFLFNKRVYSVVALSFIILINEKVKNVMTFRHSST